MTKIIAVSGSGPLMALAKPGGQKVDFEPLWRKDKLFSGNTDREVNHAGIKKALTITR